MAAIHPPAGAPDAAAPADDDGVDAVAPAAADDVDDGATAVVLAAAVAAAGAPLHAPP